MTKVYEVKKDIESLGRMFYTMEEAKTYFHDSIRENKERIFKRLKKELDFEYELFSQIQLNVLDYEKNTITTDLLHYNIVDDGINIDDFVNIINI